MFRNKFNLRNVVAIAICLAGMTAFFSCEKNNDKDLKNTVLEQNYFTIQDGTVHKGAIPSSTSGISIADGINLNRNALTGGSSYVTLATEEQISEFYVGVKGVDYYFSVTPQNQLQSSSQAPLRAAATVNNYSLVILFSQNLGATFDIQISAKLKNGSLTRVYIATITYIQAGTGSLQINLSFNNDKDLDLYVVQPDKEVIYYGNQGEYYEEGGVPKGWGLDIDSNAACDIDGINSENVFYSNEYIQSGKYEVWVNMWENCDPSIATNWVITARYQGALLSTTFGRNPATGVFPVGTPSNEIGGSLTGATKVMEFTLSSSSLRSSRVDNTERSPLTESAKIKLERAGKIIEE